MHGYSMKKNPMNYAILILIRLLKLVIFELELNIMLAKLSILLKETARSNNTEDSVEHFLRTVYLDPHLTLQSPSV